MALNDTAWLTGGGCRFLEVFFSNREFASSVRTDSRLVMKISSEA
jgi:hypothetical protein